MTPTTLTRVLAGALALTGSAVRGQDTAADRHPLRVAYVGDPKGERGQAFVGFLRAHFAAATAFGRDDADLEALQQHDVVLLDWPQGDDARAQREKGSSPLGARDQWRTPTVLLGSAGLNLAGAWQVRGGFG